MMSCICIELLIIILAIAFIAVGNALIDIITIFDGYIVTDEFIVRLTAEGNFLTATLFVIAGDFVTIDIIVSIFIRDIVQVQRCAGFLAVNPRTGIAEIIVLVILAAELPADVNLVAGTTEVFITDRNHADKAVCIAVASADTKGTRVHLDYGNFYLNSVRLTTRVQLDIYVFKIAKVINALHTATCILRIEGLALLQTHLADNNVILRLNVALHLKVLNIALVDGNLQRPVLLHMHVGNTRQDIAAGTVFLFELLHAFIYILEVSNLILRQVEEAIHLVLVQNGVAFNIYCFINRVFQHVINNLNALGNKLEFRMQVIEIAHVINSAEVFGKSCFGKFHTGLSFQHGSNFCLRHLLVAFNNLLGNCLANVRSQFILFLRLLCSLRYRGLSRSCRCLAFFSINRSS